MKCHGCYKETTTDFCLSCRKKLFNGVKISSVLPFDAPKAETLLSYQEHSKRLSISGVQLKYTLYLNESNLELREKGGQYIIKPIPTARQLKNLKVAPENEHLTMQIAEQVFKINVANNGLLYFMDNQPAYITKRFDIKPDGSKFLQEDFAQLTNRSKITHREAFKYEGTYEEIGILIKKYVSAYMPALEEFFKQVLFNYIISNGDAHLKNFSLYRNDEGEYKLTPAYDLMSTVIHTPTESDMALSLYSGDINSTFYSTYGCYGKPDFMEFAKRIGIIPKRAERILNEFILFSNKADLLIDQSFLSASIKKVYQSNLCDKIKRLSIH